MNLSWLWMPGACLAGLTLAVWLLSRSRGKGGDSARTLRASPVPASPVPASSPAPQPAAPEAQAARDVPAVSPLRRVVALALDDAGAAGAPLDPAATQLLLDASQALARIGNETRYTPRRPSLLPQLLEAVNDEEASLRALARIISQDPALTGE